MKNNMLDGWKGGDKQLCVLHPAPGPAVRLSRHIWKFDLCLFCALKMLRCTPVEQSGQLCVAKGNGLWDWATLAGEMRSGLCCIADVTAEKLEKDRESRALLCMYRCSSSGIRSVGATGFSAGRCSAFLKMQAAALPLLRPLTPDLWARRRVKTLLRVQCDRSRSEDDKLSCSLIVSHPNIKDLPRMPNCLRRSS